MNQNELEKHLFFQIFFIVFVVVCMIFTIVYLLTTDVKAKQQTSNVNGSIYTDYNGDCTGGQSGYCILQTNGVAYKRSLNTTYSGVLNAISFELHYVMNSSYQYTLNINGMSSDFRNNYISVYVCGYNGSNNYNSCTSHPISVSFRFVSKSQLQIIFPVQSYETYRVEITGSPLTGISNYGIKNMVLVYDDNQADMSGVIENNNQNTTSIIDNNNSNTQDIIQQVQDLIANNEELHQELLESQNCPVGPLELYRPDWAEINNSYLDSNGNVVSGSGYGISPYIVVIPNKEYSIITTGGNVATTIHYCTYTSSKQKQYCYSYNSGNTATNTFTVNQYVQFIRISLQSSRTFALKGPVCNNWEREAQQKMNDTALDTNNYLKDDSNPTINDSAIGDTLESVAIDDPLNYLLTLPLHAIQRINYQLGRNTCSPINLGSLYGTDLILPCINVEQRIGSSLFNTIDILMAIGIGSVTLKKFYDSISNVLTLGKEKEVREKLELPTPMEFFAMIFGGGR